MRAARTLGFSRGGAGCLVSLLAAGWKWGGSPLLFLSFPSPPAGPSLLPAWRLAAAMAALTDKSLLSAELEEDRDEDEEFQRLLLQVGSGWGGGMWCHWLYAWGLVGRRPAWL